MSLGLEITYTRPSADVPFWTDYLAAQTDPSFDLLKTSYQNVLAVVDPAGSSDLKRRIVDDPATPLVRKLQWSLPTMPAGTPLDQAIIFHRKKIREVIHEGVNDASFTVSGDDSFDGTPRTYARNAVWQWKSSYDEQNGIDLTNVELKELDF